MLVGLEVSLAAMFAICFAVAVGVMTETRAKAVVDRQIGDLLIGKPSVAVAAYHRHRVIWVAVNGLMHQRHITADRKDIEVNGEKAAAIVVERVSERVPAGGGDYQWRPARIRRCSQIWTRNVRV